MPPLPRPGSVGLEVEDDGVLAGGQLGPLPRRALEVEQVVEEHHLAPAEAELALAQEQAVAAEASAIGDDHAFRAAFGDRDLGGDRVRLVQDARRAAVGDADRFARIGEDLASAREVRARRVPAQERRVVERQHVELLRLGVEEVLHLLQLVRHLRGQVVVLGGIHRLQIADVVEFPVVPGDHVGRRLGAQFPRQRRRGRRRDPAVVVDGAVAEHLEVLRRVPRGRRWRSPCSTCTPCSRRPSAAA